MLATDIVRLDREGQVLMDAAVLPPDPHAVRILASLALSTLTLYSSYIRLAGGRRSAPGIKHRYKPVGQVGKLRIGDID